MTVVVLTGEAAFGAGLKLKHGRTAFSSGLSINAAPHIGTIRTAHEYLGLVATVFASADGSLAVGPTTLLTW